MIKLNTQEINLVEQKDLREEYIEQVHVLDKVKELFLIPDMEMMTARQVVEYYGIKYDTLKKCYEYHKKEIDSDGAIVKRLKDFLKGGHFPLENKKGKTVFQISDNVLFEVPNRGIRCFSKRAILRIGMLLRFSPSEIITKAKIQSEKGEN